MKATLTTTCVISGPDGFGFSNMQTYFHAGEEMVGKLFAHFGAVASKAKPKGGDYVARLTIDLKDADSGTAIPLPPGVQPMLTLACDRGDVEDLEALMLDEQKVLLGHVKKGHGHK